MRSNSVWFHSKIRLQSHAYDKTIISKFFFFFMELFKFNSRINKRDYVTTMAHRWIDQFKFYSHFQFIVRCRFSADDFSFVWLLDTLFVIWIVFYCSGCWEIGEARTISQFSYFLLIYLDFTILVSRVFGSGNCERRRCVVRLDKNLKLIEKQANDPNAWLKVLERYQHSACSWLLRLIEDFPRESNI